jgi:hypothetical protein
MNAALLHVVLPKLNRIEPVCFRRCSAIGWRKGRANLPSRVGGRKGRAGLPTQSW